MSSLLSTFVIALVSMIPRQDDVVAKPVRPRAAAAESRVVPNPAPGKILHFHGNPYARVIENDYAAALPSNLTPIGESVWMDVPGTRDFLAQRAKFERVLARLASSGRMLNLSIAFDDGAANGFSTARDAEYATTNRYDHIVAEVATMLAKHRVPTLLRIGGEVNGAWEGHHPYVFPEAFRKMVGQFRSAGATNVAFVFCVEPTGDTAIFETNEQGAGKWYPGDEYVDWLGVDVFAAEAFAQRASEPRRRANGARTRRGELAAVAEAVLARARATGKPVFVGEATPYSHVVPDTASDPMGTRGQDIWRAWFVPFIQWLDEHPEIRAVSLCPVEWNAYESYVGWGDARIERSEWLLDAWKTELAKERWVHLAPGRARGNSY
jgi:Glycosyl hydrolase family 26